MLGVRYGDAWTMQDVWEKQDYTETKNVGRIAHLLADAVELGLRGEAESSLATTILALQNCHQVALDKGSWRVTPSRSSDGRELSNSSPRLPARYGQKRT